MGTEVPPKTGETPPPTKSEANDRSRMERREQAVLDALRTLIRDLHADLFGAPGMSNEQLALTLRLQTTPREGWPLRFDPPLPDQLRAQIEEAEARTGGFQPGHVYCFRCESAACEHAKPPSALTVFTGYTPTGVPEWQDLGQVLIAARDERVDRLYATPPGIVTRIQLGHELRLRQLSSFGRASRTYAILGQVIGGYFLLPRPFLREDTDPRLALTAQVVESRDPHGQLRLELNLLARLPEGHDLEELLVAKPMLWVYRARSIATQELQDLERLVHGAEGEQRSRTIQDALRRIPAVLKHLSESLERGFRQDQRRTSHAEERRAIQRPVHKALEDANAIALASLFWDEKTDAFIACGAQNRAHVFTRDGRHVTSFVIQPESIRFRVRTHRWRPATAEEMAGWKKCVSPALAVPTD